MEPKNPYIFIKNSLKKWFPSSIKIKFLSIMLENKKETWIVVSNIFYRRKTGIYSIFPIFKKSSWAQMDSAKSRRLWFEWCILFTMKELPENKLIKRQVFLQKSQNQFISEVHEAIKIVPHVLISINCLGKFTFGSRSMYWLHVIPSLFAICAKYI